MTLSSEDTNEPEVLNRLDVIIGTHGLVAMTSA